MLNTALGRFRWIALLEGTSFLILVFIAMPLKYFMGMPLYVKYVGWAHGLLFILYFLALAHAYAKYRWSIKTMVWCVLASFLPFGTFVLDSKILKKEKTVNRL